MRAPCSSPLWDLGLLHPSHLFCVCDRMDFGVSSSTLLVHGSSCSLPLSLHDDCVISFSLTHTYTTLLHQILSSNLLTLYIHYEIKSLVPHPLFPSHPNPFNFPHSFSHANFFAFPSPKKNQTHAPCIHPISTAWQHQSFYSYYSSSSIPSSQQQAVVPSTTPTTRM